MQDACYCHHTIQVKCSLYSSKPKFSKYTFITGNFRTMTFSSFKVAAFITSDSIFWPRNCLLNIQMQDACYCHRTIQVKCPFYSLLSRFYIVNSTSAAVDLECNRVMSDFPIIMVSEVQILKQKLELAVPQTTTCIVFTGVTCIPNTLSQYFIYRIKHLSGRKIFTTL